MGNLKQILIQPAADLLRSSTLSVQQIVEQCGFADGNYFTRIFKKLRGVTPNEHRGSSRPAGEKAPARVKQRKQEDTP